MPWDLSPSLYSDLTRIDSSLPFRRRYVYIEFHPTTARSVQKQNVERKSNIFITDFMTDWMGLEKKKIRDDKPFVVKLCHVDGNRRDEMREEIFLETAKSIEAFQSNVGRLTKLD